jgi:outer membrane immunogenic protein
MVASIALASLAVVELAAAADIPVKAPVYAPPAVVADTWTGFYVGLGIGVRSSVTDTTVPNWTTGAFGGSPPTPRPQSARSWLLIAMVDASAASR